MSNLSEGTIQKLKELVKKQKSESDPKKKNEIDNEIREMVLTEEFGDRNWRRFTE